MLEEATNAFDVGAVRRVDDDEVAVVEVARLVVKPLFGVALTDFLTNCWLPVECDG